LPPAVPFDCWTAADGPDAARVHVTGDLDIATTPRLEARIRGALADMRLVVVDLGDLEFIDSSGVHRLFTLTGTVDQLDFGRSQAPVGRRVDTHEAELAAVPFELAFVAGLNIAYGCIKEARLGGGATGLSRRHLETVRAGCTVIDYPGLATILADLGHRADAGELGTPEAVVAFIDEAERGVPADSPAHGLFGGLGAGAVMQRESRQS